MTAIEGHPMNPDLWCEECKQHECPFCHDFNSDDPDVVYDHAAECDDREPGDLE